MTKVRDLHARWMEDADYRARYGEMEEEFALARTLIEARIQAGLTQAELAERMNTTQSAIARLESGKRFPSTRTLQNWARATGTRLIIQFERDSGR